MSNDFNAQILDCLEMYSYTTILRVLSALGDEYLEVVRRVIVDEFERAWQSPRYDRCVRYTRSALSDITINRVISDHSELNEEELNILMHLCLAIDN